MCLVCIFFGGTTIKKKTVATMKVCQYEESPYYKNILANNKTIYLNVLSSNSPHSFERYEELMKDSGK